MNNSSPDMIYWIWLSLALGPGCRNSTEILDVASFSAKTIYFADEAQLNHWNVFKKYQIEKLLVKDLSESERILNYCINNSITIINPRSEKYPRLLARIPSCPIVLYVLGTLPDFNQQISVAVVGTRKMTKAGQRTAYEISYDLAKSGVIITSGMALGVDGVCHSAALDCGGVTIAVLGCGIDIVYPAQHRELMENIIASNGAVISEFAPGTRPLGGNFPTRNRIISGLTVGTVIIEAGEKSGALNTASHAFEQGRDVFAVPGPIGENNSIGSNNLLKNGAIAITCGGDIIDFYTLRYGNKISFKHIVKIRDAEYYKPLPNSKISPYFREQLSKPAKKKSTQDNIQHKIQGDLADKTTCDSKNNKSCDKSEAENNNSKILKEALFSSADGINKRIYDTIEEESKFPDQIATELSISISEVLTNITVMEIQGLIKRLPGGQYIAK